MDDVYTRLRDKIDQYSLGFAETKSGVEIKILKKLFTEEEAEMYLNLTADLQTAENIANNINRDTAEVEDVLKRMTVKGHTLPRFPKKVGEPFYYAAAPYVHGIVEHQLHRMDAELAELIEEHFVAGPITRPIHGLRTIPVKESIDESIQVFTYDDVENVILKKKRIALADCACNDMQKTRGEKCNQPSEVCFLFDFYAEYYVERGLGRWVTKKEALAKLKECDQAGLVSQFSNSENPESLCNCCPDCCGNLRGIKRFDQPALLVASNHYALANAELCSECEVCFDRCPMEAIRKNEKEIVEVNPDRCIGCGLCVGTCPTGALRLAAKSGDQRFIPPKKGVFMKSSEEFEAILSISDTP